MAPSDKTLSEHEKKELIKIASECQFNWDKISKVWRDGRLSSHECRMIYHKATAIDQVTGSGTLVNYIFPQIYC